MKFYLAFCIVACLVAAVGFQGSRSQIYAQDLKPQNLADIDQIYPSQITCSLKDSSFLQNDARKVLSAKVSLDLSKHSANYSLTREGEVERSISQELGSIQSYDNGNSVWLSASYLNESNQAVQISISLESLKGDIGILTPYSHNYGSFHSSTTLDCISAEADPAENAALSLQLINAMLKNQLSDSLELLKKIDNPALLSAAFARAVTLGNLSLAKEILKKNPDLNRKGSHDKSPLHLAIARSNSEMVEFLIKSGASTEAQDQNGETPIFYALEPLYSEDADLYKKLNLLLEAGANVNAMSLRKLTPLHSAALRESSEAAKLLLKKGAKVDGVDPDSPSPLTWIPKRLSLEVAEVLLENGADIHRKTAYGQNILHEVLSSNQGGLEREDSAEFVAFLIRHGAEVNVADQGGETPLNIAIRARRKAESLQLIIAGGSAPNLNEENQKWLDSLLPKALSQ